MSLLRAKLRKEIESFEFHTNQQLENMDEQVEKLRNTINLIKRHQQRALMKSMQSMQVNDASDIQINALLQRISDRSKYTSLPTREASLDNNTKKRTYSAMDDYDKSKASKEETSKHQCAIHKAHHHRHHQQEEDTFIDPEAEMPIELENIPLDIDMVPLPIITTDHIVGSSATSTPLAPPYLPTTMGSTFLETSLSHMDILNVFIKERERQQQVEPKWSTFDPCTTTTIDTSSLDFTLPVDLSWTGEEQLDMLSVEDMGFLDIQ